MKKVLVKILAVCFLISAIIPIDISRQAKAVTQEIYYVSTSGSDSNAGTQSAPFLTIAKAQEMVRAINGNMTGDIIVYLMGGTYNIPSTLSFNQTDSGTNGYNVIYKAYTGQTPIVSGGQEVTGWSLHDAGKNIYRANVGTFLNTRQFYVDGVRAVRAKGVNNPSGFSVSANGFNIPTTGTYATMASWGNLRDVEVISMWNWKCLRMGIEYISGNQAYVKQPGWGYVKQQNQGPNNPSWIENAYELMDSPGEWYLDRTTGYMYYIPRIGENMSTSTFIAAKVETLLSGIGTLDTPIHNIQFDGITFAYNTWLMPSGNNCYADRQAGCIINSSASGDPANWLYTMLKTPAGVTFSTAKNIIIKNCNFTHMGNAALSFDYGSQNNVIDYNTFSDISGNGVNIGGIDNAVDHHPSDTRIIVKDNTVSNNTITKIGVEYIDNVGIFIGYTDGTVVKHNTLYDLPYTAISVGWGWGYVDTLGTPVSKNIKITHNKINDFMNTLVDGGAIYTLGSMPNTYINNNYVTGHNGASLCYLYCDNGSAYITLTNNVVSSANGISTKWYYSATGYSQSYYNSFYNTATNNYISSNLSVHAAAPTVITSPNTFVWGSNWPTNAVLIMNNSGVGGADEPSPLAPNLALNKTATVSNYYQNNATYSGAKAVDGNSATRWATDNPIRSAWIEINFGATTTFNKTVLKECTDYGQRIKTYEVQYWNGSAWVNAYSGGIPATIQTDTFDSVSSNKVRLNITSINGSLGPTVWDFEVYNDAF